MAIMNCFYLAVVEKHLLTLGILADNFNLRINEQSALQVAGLSTKYLLSLLTTWGQNRAHVPSVDRGLLKVRYSGQNFYRKLTGQLSNTIVKDVIEAKTIEINA
jgi:hypothetical protein